MYLSYSGHKSYSVCPRQYWHSYVNKTAPLKPENAVNSLYGSTVGTLFEYFYADKLWLRTGVEALLLSMVESTLDTIISKEVSKDTSKRVVDYTDKASNYKSRDALLRDVREAIPRGIAIIRYHRLLGTDAEAEVKLDSWMGGHRIGGRADFIMRRIKPHGDLVILDGKGSRHRDKYVDAWQLKWYAMLYREKHVSVPDALGFVFWRYDPDKSMDWVDFQRADLDDLRESVLMAATAIETAKAKLVAEPESHAHVLQESFSAKPSQNCRLCAFLGLCGEGQAYEKASLPAAFLADAGVDDVGL